MAKNNPDIVYQYLKYSAFCLMIENNTIRLSDIQSSNDTTETKLIYDFIYQVLLEEYRKDDTKFMDKYLPVNQFEIILRDIQNDVQRNNQTSHTQFVSCFSERGDLLSQWRGYADDYKNPDNCGVSVGFDVTQLKSVAEDLRKHTSLETSFDQVIYAPRNQRAYVRKELFPLIRSLKNDIKENKGISDKGRIALATGYENVVIKLSAFLKHPFFNEEKEWRIAHWAWRECSGENTTTLSTNDVFSNEEYYSKYQQWISNKSESKPSGYYYLIMKDPNKYIREVFIGPKCKHTKEEVQAYLKQHKIDCPVNDSVGRKIFVDSVNHNT